MGGISLQRWLQARNVGEQHGYQAACTADEALAAICYAAFKQQLVPLLELDHSQLGFYIQPGDEDYTNRFKDMLTKLLRKTATPAIVVVKIEADTAGHLLQTGPHTNLTATPEAQAAALARGYRVASGMRLFKAWGTGQFDGLGGMSGAVEVVFIPSGILENDSSHSLHYDVVLEAVSKQQAKLDTWVRDPVRLFPDHTFSPSINEMLEAALQQMPKDQPVVIPCNNDYDSLLYCLVRRADLFVLLTGSLLEGAKASRFFMVKPVLARLGLSDPVQTLLFKAATQSDYMEGSKPACIFAEYDSLAQRFMGVAQSGFSVQSALDAAAFHTPMTKRGFLFGFGTDLAMPSTLRLDGLRSINLTEADDGVFDGHGLPGISAGRRLLQELEQRSALPGLLDLSTHLNFTGNGLLVATGLSATAMFRAGQGKPPLAPTFYQLAMRAVQEQQLVVGGPLDPGLISAHQVRAILQLHGAMPARTLFNLARIKPIGDAGNASYGSVLSGLQERLPAGVCFHTATVSARGSATLRSDTTWVALSQQQLVDANNNLKVAECGIAQERAERVLEQVGPTLEQCESGALPVHQVLDAQGQYHFAQDCEMRSDTFTDAFIGTLREHGVVVLKTFVCHDSAGWNTGFLVATSQEAATALQQQNQARFEQYTAERQAKLQEVADRITQQLEQPSGTVSLSSLSLVFGDSFGINGRGLPLQLQLLGNMAAVNLLPSAVLFQCANAYMLARSLLHANNLLRAQRQATIEYGMQPLLGGPGAQAAAAAATVASAAAATAASSSEKIRTRSRSVSPGAAAVPTVSGHSRASSPAAAAAADLKPPGRQLRSRGSSTLPSPAAAAAAQAANLPPSGKQLRSRLRSNSPSPAAAAHAVDLPPARQRRSQTRSISPSPAAGGRAAGLPPPAKQRRIDDADAAPAAVAAAAAAGDDVINSDDEDADPPDLALGKKIMATLSSPPRAVVAKMLAHTGFVYRTNPADRLVKLQDALRAAGITPFVFRPGGRGAPVVVALNADVLGAQYNEALGMASKASKVNNLA